MSQFRKSYKLDDVCGDGSRTEPANDSQSPASRIDGLLNQGSSEPFYK